MQSWLSCANDIMLIINKFRMRTNLLNTNLLFMSYVCNVFYLSILFKIYKCRDSNPQILFQVRQNHFLEQVASDDAVVGMVCLIELAAMMDNVLAFAEQ